MTISIQNKQVEIGEEIIHILTDSQLKQVKDDVKRGHEKAYGKILGTKLNKTYNLGLTGGVIDNNGLEFVIRQIFKKANGII